MPSMSNGDAAGNGEAAGKGDGHGNGDSHGNGEPWEAKGLAIPLKQLLGQHNGGLQRPNHHVASHREKVNRMASVAKSPPLRLPVALPVEPLHGHQSQEPMVLTGTAAAAGLNPLCALPTVVGYCSG